jgi:hypothetical protein
VVVTATGAVTATSVTVNGGDNGDVGGNLGADGGDVVISTTGGIAVGGITAANDFVRLSAGTTITDADGGTANSITASLVSLAAGTGIGASGTSASIETNAATVNAGTNTGGIFINSLAAGDVLFGSVDANAGGIELRSVGNINLGVVDAGSAGVLIDSSAGAINDDLADNDDASPAPVIDIIGGTLVLDAANGIGDTRRIEIRGNSSSITTTNGGIGIDDQGSTGSTVTVLTLSAGGAISYATAANLLVGTVESTSGGTITLTSREGYIADNADDGAVDIVGGAVILTAANGIGGDPTNTFANDFLEIASSSLDLTTTTAGADIMVADVAGSAGAYNDPAGTSLLLVDTFGGTGDVTINAAGGVTDGNGPGTNIIGNVFTISAGGVIDLDTAVTTLNIPSATGTVNIDNGANALVVGVIGAAGQAVTLRTTGAGNSITEDGDGASDISAATLTLSSGGAIDLDTTLTGALTILAAGGAVDIDNGSTPLVIGNINAPGQSVTLSTTGGSLGVAALDMAADVTAATLDLSSGGTITLDLAVDTLVLSAGGQADLYDANGFVGTLSGTVVNITSAGNIIIDTAVDTLNVTTVGDVLVEEADTLNGSITARTLDLVAGSATLATAIENLSFNVAGTLTVTEADAVTLVGSNTAGTSVSITAVTDILSPDGVLTSPAITLISLTGIIGTIQEPIQVVTTPSLIFASVGPDNDDFGFIAGDNFTTADFRRVLQISGGKVFVFGAFSELVASVQGSFITAPSFSIDPSQFRTDLNIYGLDGSGVTLPRDQCEDEESPDCERI